MLIVFMKRYTNKNCAGLTQSKYITDPAAPLLVGSLINSIAGMLKLAFLMEVNGYSFKTYAPKSDKLVSFPASTQHFSMDYYLDNLENGVELLEELMGENDY